MSEETESTNWGKYTHYQNKFKEHGLELKLMVKMKGYRKCQKCGAHTSVHNDLNDFTVYFNGKYSLNFYGIGYDIIDCILFGYLRGIEHYKEANGL